MAFRRAILPAVLSWADKPVMIGNLLEHIPNSLPMLHLLYHLYGRTVVIFLTLFVYLDGFLKIADHIGRCFRGVDDVLRGIDDALREVARIADNPLRPRRARKEQAHAEK